MGSWIAAIGALVAAMAAMVGVSGYHMPPHHHQAPNRYTSPSPTPTPGMGGNGGGSHRNGGPTGTAAPVLAPLQTTPAGTVTLSVDSPSGRVAARLNMFGLAPGTQHRVALYDDRGRNLAFSFPDVTVNSSGGLQQTVLSYEQALQGLSGGLSFQIDLLPTQGGGSPASQVIAVANGDGPSARQGQVTLQFKSTLPQSGTAPLVNMNLTVSLQLSGLVPGSEHAASLHTGSCQLQGSA